LHGAKPLDLGRIGIAGRGIRALPHRDDHLAINLV
jgi:hypothetical protein